MKITTEQIFDYLEESNKPLFKPNEAITILLKKIKNKFPKLYEWLISKKDYDITSNKEVKNVIDMLFNGNIDENQAISQIRTKFAYNESSNGIDQSQSAHNQEINKKIDAFLKDMVTTLGLDDFRQVYAVLLADACLRKNYMLLDHIIKDTKDEMVENADFYPIKVGPARTPKKQKTK